MKTINRETIAVLREQLEDDEIIKEVIQAYLEHSPKHIENIKNFLLQKNIGSASKEAHTLKSSTKSLGAELLGSYCQQLENLKTSDNFTEAENLLSQIEIEYAKVEQEFKNLDISKL